MELWIYVVLLAQLIWSVCSLIDKFVIHKGHIKNPLVYIAVNGITQVFIIFLIPFIKIGLLGFFDFAMALISSITVMAGIALYYKAVQYDEISRINILFQIIPVFTFILSFLILGEIITGYHFLGFLLLITGGILVSCRKTKKSFKFSRAFYYLLPASMLIAISYIAAKHVFNITNFWNGVFWLRLTGLAVLFTLFIPQVKNDFVHSFKNMNMKIKKLLFFKMVIDFSAFILSDLAILLGPVTLVSALASSSAPVLVFILALFTSLYAPQWVKEDIDKNTILLKAIAIILVVTGVIFVSS